VRLKESGVASEVIAVATGTAAAQEILRTALAFGADRALLAETTDDIQPLAVARILQVIVQRESPGLCLLGKQAIDTDDNQTGQMLAGLLHWAQGTFASKIIVSGESVEVTREVDGGLQTVQLKLPAVVTADLRLNQPRYLSLPAIVRARQKPLAVIPVADLPVDTTPRISILKVSAPQRLRAGMRIDSAAELVSKLRATGVIA